MELGEKLLAARQEAGLSQRQLCGGIITRNMLSQIEHGTARPSMDTLRYLASRLGKPVSFFLEEDVVTSPNQALLAQARARYEEGKPEEARQLLHQFRQPDPVLEWEWKFLSAMAVMDSARQAMAEGKALYARRLLEEDAFQIPALERQRLLLLGQLPDGDLEAIVRQLPSLDGELLLRAEAAMAADDPNRAGKLLEAAEDQAAPRWNLLRGRVYLLRREYAPAADCLQKAEDVYPALCFPLLEICFRELGDFQNAYFYACRQRELTGNAEKTF